MTVAEKTGTAAGMDGAVALRSLVLHSVLSFGGEKGAMGMQVDLGPLNVLIGPNGCGKSNLMDVVGLLKLAATGNLSDEFRGGALDWPWKGGDEPLPVMAIGSEWESNGAFYKHAMAIRVFESGAYSIKYEDLRQLGKGGVIERGEGADSRASLLRVGSPIVFKQGYSLPLPAGAPGAGVHPAPLIGDPESARRDLSALVGNVCVYRNRYVGRGRGPNPLRVAGRADGEKWRIPEGMEDFSMVLNRVYPQCGDVIDEKMREFYESARKLHFSVFDGAVQIKMEEANGRIIPASRMSDGMLNWLFLLTVLLDPAPPPLVCIDEPETGLHPHMLPTLARMLIDASARMQLIVTTHSDIFLDCFADLPEAVMVCDKVDGVTQMKRLRAEEFQGWKEGLGMAWISGAIGGTRW